MNAVRCFYQTVVTTVALAFISARCVFGAALPHVEPGEVGISESRLKRIDSLVRQRIDSGALPGAVVAVARHGKIVYFKAEGSASLSDPTPLRKDAIFRMYSSTKPVTAVALLQLYEQGAFQLDEPVTRLLPELADPLVGIGAKHAAAARPITIRQLITHTSGLSYGNKAGDPVDVAYRAARLWEANDLEDFVHRVAQLPLRYQPGETWNYSVGMDLAGLVVQRVAGQSFRSYLKEHVFGPLGMVDTDFVVPVGKRGRLVENHVMDRSSGLAETFAEGDPSTVPGGIFSEGCFALCNFDSVTLYSGGAGLVSTPHDYLRFAEMLRNEGELDGVRVLGAKTVQYMTRNHYGSEISPGVGFGLGLPIVVDAVANGVIGSSGAYYHDGAAGTIFFIDPVEELVILGFTQVLMQLDWGKDLRVVVYQAIDRPAGDSQGAGKSHGRGRERRRKRQAGLTEPLLRRRSRLVIR